MLHERDKLWGARVNGRACVVLSPNEPGIGWQMLKVEPETLLLLQAFSAVHQHSEDGVFGAVMDAISAGVEAGFALSQKECDPQKDLQLEA